MINNNTSSQGEYAITEQGDLGLGLFPIEEGTVTDKGKNDKDKDKTSK